MVDEQAGPSYIRKKESKEKPLMLMKDPKKKQNKKDKTE
jgi:hypothetical protein